MGLRDLLKKKVKPKDVDGLREKMDDLLASVADKFLTDDVIEAGRQSIQKRFKDENIEWNSKTLRAVNLGLELMLAAGSDDHVRVPILMVGKKLVAAEEGIEKINTKQ